MQQGPHPPDPNQPPPYNPQQGGYAPPPGQAVPPPAPGYGDPNLAGGYGDPALAGYATQPMGMAVESPAQIAEALNEQDRQKTRITAFITAVLVHVVIVAVLLAMILPTTEEPDPVITAIAAPNDTENTQVVEFNQSRKRSKPAKSSASAKLITSSATTTFSVPTVETDNTTGIGFGDDFGDGIGMFGDGDGGGVFIGIPKVVRGRCDAADRAQRLRENGGTPQCEEAVMKGLRWLKTNQNDDGSWGDSRKHAMTGLAILAFLGHCETTDSKEFGDTVMKGIVWLVEKGLKNDGKLAADVGQRHWVYEHGIASYALAESYTMTRGARRRVPQLRQIVTMATKRIIDAQNTNGGWFYAYEQTGTSDTSITGWHIQAVKAATYTKLPIDDMKACINKAADYLESAQGAEGAFGYHNASGQRYSMTGVGVLGLQMADRGNKREAKKGIDFILDKSKKELPVKYNDSHSDLYAWYYNTLALFQRGKKDWAKWNNWFRDEVLSGQNADGSWNAEGGSRTKGGSAHVGGSDSAGGGKNAVIYRTCLCTLMLEVYYRYLPTGR